MSVTKTLTAPATRHPLPAAPFSTIARKAAGPVSALLLLAVWSSIVSYFNIPEVVFPSPWGVLKALWSGLFVDGLFWRHILVTLYQIIAGFAIGAGIGLALGLAIAELPLVKVILHPYVIAFQNVPKVAIAPLFVIWFGFGSGSKIAIAATIAFFPVVINVIAGLRAADEKNLEMVHIFGGGSLWKLLLVRLPTALPFLFAGLDIAMVLAIVGSIVGEFVGAKEGLGYLIMQYNFTLDMNGIFAVLLIYTMIGYLLHAVIVTAQKYSIWWNRAGGDRAFN